MKRRKKSFEFRIGVLIKGTDTVIALGGMVASEDFPAAALELRDLQLVLLPPSHSLNKYAGDIPAPVFRKAKKKRQCV